MIKEWKEIKMKNTFEVKLDYGYQTFLTKEDLYNSFFTDFYNFMLENTDVDFKRYGIKNLNAFLKFSATWEADDSHSFYGVGHAFGKYFVHKDVGGKLEEQPKTSFVGYLYKRELYTEFIPFLMRFFEYWRTDEGYSFSANDPDNTGNDFFADPWASLVDTCKFFHFTSKNLNDTYAWFKSERVKDALDNIPGVNLETIIVGSKDNPVTLKELKREEYTFLGWYDSKKEDANKLTVIDQEMTVYAKWKRNK